MTDNLADVLARFRPAWMRHAACAGMDTDLFFPERGDVAKANAARRICAACPVRTQCLEWAIAPETRAEAGVFGGKTIRERRQITGVGWGRVAKEHGTRATMRTCDCAECQARLARHRRDANALKEQARAAGRSLRVVA